MSDSQIKVLGSLSYIGTTGINNHFREFFRALSPYCDLRIRNFTVGTSWNGLGTDGRPHEKEPYLNDTDREALYLQTLWTNGNRVDYPIYSKFKENLDGKFDVNIISDCVGHYYFYDKYIGPKIGYTVWESTHMPQDFFNQLMTFDEVWVPSKWQKKYMVLQGAEESKIQVVPGGVDDKVFRPEEVSFDQYYSDGRFKFIIFGRWDYRKCTEEIIRAFLKEFKKDEPVDLIISVDNPFPKDDMKTTEERLKRFGFEDERIKILHFPSREDYVKFMKKGHVFLSCARGEGWNLPLIEAMACGTPSIYSNCTAQLEFAEGRGHPVNIAKELPSPICTGNYWEPDFEHLQKVMRKVYENYDECKKKALVDSEHIRKHFNWEEVGRIGAEKLYQFYDKVSRAKQTTAKTMNYELIDSYKSNGLPDAIKNDIHISFRNGAKVEVLGPVKENYEVKFIDRLTGAALYTANIKENMWCSPNKKYYVDWKIEVYRDGQLVAEEGMNLKHKLVKIVIDSNSLGDILAYIGAVHEFQQRHQCVVHCVVFPEEFRRVLAKSYSNISFKAVNDADEQYYAVYKLGCFTDWEGMAKYDPRTISLANVASDILGLGLNEFKPELKFEKRAHKGKKYVCIATQSTAQFKYWNNKDGWKKVIKYLNSLGYEVWCIDRDYSFGIAGHMNVIPEGAIDKTGNIPLDVRMQQIHNAEFFIGLSSGLSWLAWAINKPVILISGMTEPWLEFYTPHRVINKNVCHGCWNDTSLAFDKTNWLYCPRKKNFECSTAISAEMVIEEIENLRSGKKKFDFERFFGKYRSSIRTSGTSRLKFYEYIIPKLVALNKPLHILETGTMWAPLKDNMGAFTLIMSDLIHNYTGGRLYTVDISKESLDKCKEFTKEFADSIEYVQSDSVAYLNSLSDELVGKLDLVYLDSYDLFVPNPHPSAQHHFNELKAIYYRISPECKIAVDDNFVPNTYIIWKWYNDDGTYRNSERFDFHDVVGKGMYCHKFLLDAGWKRFSDFDVVGMNNVFYYERQRMSKERVEAILNSFYDKAQENKPVTTKFLDIKNVKNGTDGLGDALVISTLNKQKNILANFYKFDELTKFIPNYTSNVAGEWFDINTSDLATFDWNGGHCIQRLEKAFLGKTSLLPKPAIKADRKMQKKKVATHFKTSSVRNQMNCLDQETIDSILNFLNKERYEVLRCEDTTNLSDMINQVATCEYFVGIDSGPMHVAAGLGLKSIIILNREDSNQIYLPKIREVSVPNSEWLYPQNVHLSMRNENELIQRFSIPALKLALAGKLYPYFSEEYLDLYDKGILKSWNYDAASNKLAFSFNKNISDCTLVLKELTTNLTCYHWKMGDVAAGSVFFVVPLSHIKLSDTDFSGFVFNVYEKGVKVWSETLTINSTPKPRKSRRFYSNDALDMEVQDSFYVQYADFYVSKFLDEIVKPGDTVIDVGASCGTFAEAAFQRGASKVVCLEPSPSFEILFNSFGGEVVAARAALDTALGQKEFCFTNQTTLNTFDIESQKKYDSANLINTAKREMIPCIDLATLMREVKLDKIGLLKIDIEGYEYEIFRHLTKETLAPISRVLVEFHHNDNHQVDVIENKLREAGFDVRFMTLSYDAQDTRNSLQGVIHARREPFTTDSLGVVFVSETDDKLGMNFNVKNSELREIEVVIADTFTNVVFHRETLRLKKADPGFYYFTKHAYVLPNQSFRFYDKLTGILLLERIVNANADMDTSHFLESNRNLSALLPIYIRDHREIGYSFFEIYHRNTYNKFGCGIERGDVVFDLGANVGMFSRYAFQKGAKTVHAFEPNKLLRDCYFSLNEGRDCVFNVGAVYSKPMAFKSEVDGVDILGLKVVDVSPEYPDVHINLMDYINKHGIDKIDYLKVDIEGAEYDLFENLTDDYLKNNVKKVVLEYHENKGQVNNITSKLARCGFEVNFEYPDGASRELGMLYALKR